MGQEIQYCSRCQVRIMGTDFEKGEAYRVGEQVACNTCAMGMLATAPLAVQQQILDQKKRAIDKKAAPAPSVSRGLAGSSTAMRTPVQPARSAKGPLAALVGIGAMVAFLLVILLKSGGSPAPPPAPAPAPKVAAPGPSPQVIAAQGALQAAKSFARDNPTKIDEQTALFEKIVTDHARTPSADEARRELEAIARKRKEGVAAERTSLLSRAREMSGNGEYQKAADLLAGARKNHAEPEWTKPIDDRIQELEKTMAAEFPALRDKAVDARKRDGTAELQLMRDKVARWGSARYTEELEKALAEVFPPITPKDGALKLWIAEATLQGNNKFSRTKGTWSVIQHWSHLNDYVEWSVLPPQAGTYTIKMNYALPKEMKGTLFGGEVEIAVAGGEKKQLVLESTASWADFKTITYGTLTLPATTCTVTIRPIKIVTSLMSLRFVELVPVK